MKKIEYIKYNDRDNLGKLFFEKAITFINTRDYGKAYEYIKEGLDILTCDCMIGFWLNKLDSNNELFTDINIEHTPTYEYFFVKSFIFSYKTSKKDLYLALDSIERYVENIKDEYGYYLMGKIFNSLENSNKALDSFYKSKEFSSNSRILYRIGRTKEQNLELHGLEDLYNSFLLNPSSVCCARELKEYANKRGIELFDRENDLIRSFNQEPDEYVFQRLYEYHFNKKHHDSIHNEFISSLTNNYKVFKEIDKEYYNDYNESESYGEYAGSYAQDIEGLSDDFINDVLDGDPDAYWNID